MRGEAGATIVDQAWRTAGIRELVTIPLYLTALLALPENAPFPKTKEEVLRRFVAAHEQNSRHTESLRTVIDGFQQDYLDGLAVLATSTANTSISDSNARGSISNTAKLLVENPTLMRMRELEVLEKIASAGHLKVVLGGEKGLVDRVTNLL